MGLNILMHIDIFRFYEVDPGSKNVGTRDDGSMRFKFGFEAIFILFTNLNIFLLGGIIGGIRGVNG